MSEKIDLLKPELFIDGPAEFLVKEVAQCIADVPQFFKIFGEFIDPYKRMDYSHRSLPACRVYNLNYNRQYDSWFIEGDIVIDMMFPANLRRVELEQLPDIMSAAMLQHFRRPRIFTDLKSRVFGLNELGKRFQVDKNLAFEYEDSTLVPLTQITINFKIDLREWDDHLEATNRTKDDPFEETLGNLELLFGRIDGLEDQDDLEVRINVEQNLEE